MGCKSSVDVRGARQRLDAPEVPPASRRICAGEDNGSPLQSASTCASTADKEADSRLLCTSPRHSNFMLKLKCPSCDEAVLFPGGMRMRNCGGCDQVIVLHSEARARAQGAASIAPALNRELSAHLLDRKSKDYFTFLNPAVAAQVILPLLVSCRRRAPREPLLEADAKANSMKDDRDQWKRCIPCNAFVLVPSSLTLDCPRCELASRSSKLQSPEAQKNTGAAAALLEQLSEDAGSDPAEPVALKRVVSAMCSVCFSRASDAILAPCGHSGICVPCALEMVVNDQRCCPFCRNDIVKVTQFVAMEEQSAICLAKTVWRH